MKLHFRCTCLILFLNFFFSHSQTPNFQNLKDIQYSLHHPSKFAAVPTVPSRSATISEPAATITFTGNVIISSVERTITNTDTTTARWQFADMPLEFNEVVASMKARLTNPADTAASRIELLWLVAEYMKFQGRWENNALCPLMVNSYDTILFARLYDLMGWYYSMHSMQCGQYAMLASCILIETGYFQPIDFREVSFYGNDTISGHSLIEIRINGYFSLADFDPGMAGFLFPNPAFGGRYLSAWDIHYNPALAVRAVYGNQPWLPDHAIEEYQLVFTVDTPHLMRYRPAFSSAMHSQTGKFSLPGKSAIYTQMGIPIGFVDMTDSLYETSRAAFDSCMARIANGQNNYYDTIRLSVQAMFNTELSWVDSLLGDGKVYVYNSLTDQGKQLPVRYNRTPVPVWEISVGSYNTIAMPLVVLSVENNTLIGDTMGPFIIPLWNNDHSVYVDHQAFNYLNGSMVPGTQVTCAVNAHTLQPTGEWNLNMMQGTVATSTVVTFVEKLITSVPQELSNDGINVYPNPTNSFVTITGAQPQDVEIISVTGIRYTIPASQNIIHLDGFAKGIYLLRFTNNQKIVTKKIVKL